MKCTFDTMYQKNPYLIKGDVLLVSSEVYFDCPIEISNCTFFKRMFEDGKFDFFDFWGFDLDELTFEVITQYQNLVRKTHKKLIKN